MIWGVKQFGVIRQFKRLLGLLCLSLPFSAVADQSLPALLKQTKVMACAQTESQAKQALSSLWAVEDSDQEYPDENMLRSDDTVLHAATLDVVLKSLVDTAERYPALRNQIERTMLKWNYCDVFQDGVFYDLEKTDAGYMRFRSSDESPENWQGFKKLGFLGAVENRFVPQILALDQQSLRSDYEWLFHRIYREQCFPHPDTSELFDISETRLKENTVTTVVSDAGEYPHAWDPECVYPREAPNLASKVVIEEIPVVVPVMATEVKLVPVPQLVPNLSTSVELIDLALPVPALKSSVLLVDVPQLVPQLATSIDLQPVPVAVPQIRSSYVIESFPLQVPGLLTKVKLDVLPLKVPTLNTRFWVDKPKYVAPKPRPKPAYRAPTKYVDNRGAYPTGDHTHAPVQPVPQVAVQPVATVQPQVVVGKNASLIERLLGGVSGAGNILIVDKIQLTINEYHGTVETAISSSDIGSTISTQTKPGLVNEILEALPTQKPQQIIKAKNTITEPQAQKVVVRTPKTIVVQDTPDYVEVPDLQSMLIVNSPRVLRKPVRIKKQSVKKGRKLKSSSRRKQSGKSSSVFSYTPYPDGKGPAKEKSVAELLREYQEYERDRKLGKVPQRRKKKEQQKAQYIEQIVISEPVSYKPVDDGTRDVPPLWTEVWVERIERDDSVMVPSLDTKTRVYRKISAKPVKVPALSTMIIQQMVRKAEAKSTSNQSFEFAKDHINDEVFEKTVSPKVEVIRNQLDQLLGDSFDMKSDRLPDSVFEDTLIPSAKKRGSKKNAKKAKPKAFALGLAGNIYAKQSLKNSATSIGGSINRKLIKDSYWFARVGWNYTLEESDDPFTYSWGIGYSDWHPGTFSAQLNNWGPIKPEEGLALEKAVANFGYSVKSEFLKKNKLSLSGSINVPVKGNSSIVGNLRWSPKKNWFVNVSASQPLEGDGTPKWTYGFGYSDWRPNKINLQYSNYGPNEIPYHNYEENGTWTLSYNWKF